MTQDTKVTRHFQRIEALLAEKFGLENGRINRRLVKLGRRAPRAVRRDLARVAEAQSMAGHPMLARRIDSKATRAAAMRAEGWLKDVDLADRRRGQILGLLGSLAFNLILFFVLLLAVLRWRGYV